MGFFGKFFEKKFCDICGGEIGLLGNRKLEDGNCCKACAGKLSPWFEERRHSTIQEIQEQLQYREANKEEVKKFRTTHQFGEDKKIFLDTTHRKFLIADSVHFEEENPDVLCFSQINSVRLRIDEDRNEEKWEDKDGNMRSYTPPRYNYSYDFYMDLSVNHPYFDEMKFRLNPWRVEIAGNTSGGFLDSLLGNKNYEYRQYEHMADRIIELLTAPGENIPESAAAAPETPAAQPLTVCPYCNSPVSGGKFCGNCGAKL